VSAVRKWVAQAEIDADERPGLTSAEREELSLLRRQNERLQTDVDLLKASDGLLREGDRVKMDPFIEAEEVTGHGVKRCCEPFEVSRAAYDERRRGVPREVSDVEPAEKLTAIHAESRGTDRSPRVRRELVKRGVACGRAAGAPPHAPGRARGPLQAAPAKDTVPDPAAERAKDLIGRNSGPSTKLDWRYVGDITYLMTWEGWAYLATVIDLASRRVDGWALVDHMRTEVVEDALETALLTRRPTRARSSAPTEAASTRASTTARWLGHTVSCSRSEWPANAGTML